MKVNFELLLIVLLTILVVIIKVRSCNDSNHYSKLLSTQQDSTSIWKDESGRWHAATVAAQLSESELRKYYENEVQEIRSDYNVKLKNVTAYLKAELQTHQVLRMKADTGNVINISNTNGIDTALFHYADPWLTLNAQLHSNELTIYQERRDSISFLISHTRPWIFGPSTYMVNGISYNPNTVISGLTGVTIRIPQKRFGVGPYLGYGYYGGKWCISGGISLHFSLIQF